MAADERRDDEERDYRAARERASLELELAGVSRPMTNRRFLANWLGVIALGVVVGSAVGDRPLLAVVMFAVPALGFLLQILGDRRPRALRLCIHGDEVLLESPRRGQCIARCRREDLGVTPRHARAGDWQFLTLELAVGGRRLRLGPAGTGYRWRVETKRGPRAQYDLDHAEWVALLEALDLADQAVVPELAE